MKTLEELYRAAHTRFAVANSNYKGSFIAFKPFKEHDGGVHFVWNPNMQAYLDRESCGHVMNTGGVFLEFKRNDRIQSWIFPFFCLKKIDDENT